MITFLIFLVTAAIWLFWKPGIPDPYHGAAFAVSSIVVLVLTGLSHGIQQRQNQALQELDEDQILEMSDQLDDSFARRLISGILVALVIYVGATSLNWVGSQIPQVYGFFYSQDLQIIWHDVELLEGAGSLQAAIGVIDQNIGNYPPTVGRDLADKKYKLLIQLGQQADDDGLKHHWFEAASDWATTKNLEDSLAQAELRALKPAEVIIETVVETIEVETTRVVEVQVEVTRYIQSPPLPPGYIDCPLMTIQPAETLVPIEGELLRLWLCDNGAVKVEWLLQSGITYSATFVGEGPAVWIPNRGRFLVFVRNSKMEIVIP
jgi:hypothetical protein